MICYILTFNVFLLTENDANSGLYDEKIKDIIFGENSVYNDFYDEANANNHNTQANNNSSGACIS